jgi:hypothetical protein
MASATAENYHRLKDWVKERLDGGPLPVEVTADSLTKTDLKWVLGLVVACLGIGATVTIWILHLTGKL